MGRRAARIELSEEERDGLERLIRASLTPQQLAMRARIVLLLGEGLGIEGMADRLGIWRKTVSAWRARWLSGAGVCGTVADRLRDAPRCGGPDRIAAEEVCANTGPIRLRSPRHVHAWGPMEGDGQLLEDPTAAAERARQFELVEESLTAPVFETS